MRNKRYFFVHLVIFAVVCGTSAVAAFTSYQDYQRTVQARGLQAAAPDAARDAGAGQGVLALSGGIAAP